MPSPRSIAKRTSLIFAAALVTLFYPSMTYAEVAGDTTTPTSSQTTGPEQPTGADGKTFHLNPQTGVWENDLYTWDPVTKKTTPKSTTYSYNPETDKWSTDTWAYDAPSQKYVKVDTPTTTTVNPQTTTTANQATAAAVTNGLTSIATSGDALVSQNTLAGNATSGNASIMSNTINLLQSNFNVGGGLATTFTADIPNHVGDLILDPSLFMVQPATGCCNPTGLNSTFNIQNNDQIHNTLDLNATSGAATVDSNTTAGSATTGSANAVANIMNLANSAITAAGSFMGVINIHGDLDGDILLPPDVMAKILAGNAPTVTLDTSSIENSNLLADIQNNQTITNNITTTATSGAANLTNNTSAGSATTGTGSTNITLLNLTGHEVVGANSLLVFVNVLGKWVGLIVDAPNGTTAAVLGDNGASYGLGGNTTLNSTNNTGIINDINIAAASGDATVSNNTSAGNALSGNASASANILNMTNSSMSLSGWLGVLFINVFGSWNGSFGVDTAAGNANGRGGDAPAETATTTTGTSDKSVKVFKLASTSNGNYRLSATTESTTQTEDSTTNDDSKPKVLATTTSDKKSGNAIVWQLGGLALLAIASYLVSRRFRTSRG